MEAANSYFMLYLGFRQGLCKTICPAVESLRTEFSKYFTCFAGSVRSKQEVCGYSEKKKNLSSVHKIFEENCASVRSWHGTLCLLGNNTSPSALLPKGSPPSVSTFLLAVVLTLGSIFLSRQVSMGFWGRGSSLSPIRHHLSLPKVQLKILLMSLPAVFQTTHHGCSIFTTALLPQ